MNVVVAVQRSKRAVVIIMQVPVDGLELRFFDMCFRSYSTPKDTMT